MSLSAAGGGVARSNSYVVVWEIFPPWSTAQTVIVLGPGLIERSAGVVAVASGPIGTNPVVIVARPNWYWKPMTAPASDTLNLNVPGVPATGTFIELNVADDTVGVGG